MVDAEHRPDQRQQCHQHLDGCRCQEVRQTREGDLHGREEARRKDQRDLEEVEMH